VQIQSNTNGGTNQLDNTYGSKQRAYRIGIIETGSVGTYCIRLKWIVEAKFVGLLIFSKNESLKGQTAQPVKVRKNEMTNHRTLSFSIKVFLQRPKIFKNNT
jgi:hypothetical protein